MNHHCISGDKKDAPLLSALASGANGSAQRQFNLDFARALAIVLVTGFHVWRFHGEPASLLSPIFAQGFTGVDLFFVVSGYAMMLTHEKLLGSGWSRTAAFWKARFLRIYPTYLVAVVFWAVMVRQGVAVKPAAAYDILAHLSMLHTFDSTTFFSVSGVFWSLAVEAHFYLLFPLLVLASRKARLTLGGLSVLLTIVLEIALDGRNSPDTVVFKWNVFTFLPLFLVGVELYAVRNIKNGADKAYGIAAGLLALGLIYNPGWLYLGQVSEKTELFMLNRLAIGAALGFFCIRLMPREVPKTLATRFISLVAAASYSIYLFNYIFWILGSPFMPGLSGILATSLAVIGFGVLMWWLIEQPFESIRHARRTR